VHGGRAQQEALPTGRYLQLLKKRDRDLVVVTQTYFTLFEKYEEKF
jgi:hypothetical protein